MGEKKELLKELTARKKLGKIKGKPVSDMSWNINLKKF